MVKLPFQILKCFLYDTYSFKNKTEHKPKDEQYISALRYISTA